MLLNGMTRGLLIPILLPLLNPLLLSEGSESRKTERKDLVQLPPPSPTGKTPLEEALLKRRSIRSYLPLPLRLRDLSQLLWAGQGITSREGYRNAPSAGATFPISLLIVAGEVEGLDEGIYRYLCAGHSLSPVRKGDFRRVLDRASLDQKVVLEAPLSLIIGAIYSRTTKVYGERGKRYVLLEAGHVAQNIHLQAVALGLGTVVVGAFEDDEVKEVYGIRDIDPIYIMPVGIPAGGEGSALPPHGDEPVPR